MGASPSGQEKVEGRAPGGIFIGKVPGGRQLLELSSSPKQDRQDMSNYVHPRILPFMPGKKFLS